MQQRRGRKEFQRPRIQRRTVRITPGPESLRRRRRRIAKEKLPPNKVARRELIGTRKRRSMISARVRLKSMEDGTGKSGPRSDLETKQRARSSASAEDQKDASLWRRRWVSISHRTTRGRQPVTEWTTSLRAITLTPRNPHRRRFWHFSRNEIADGSSQARGRPYSKPGRMKAAYNWTLILAGKFRKRAPACRRRFSFLEMGLQRYTTIGEFHSQVRKGSLMSQWRTVQLKRTLQWR